MNPTEENILRAANRLRAGELVAFPTETVYGLGADATNDSAVAKIFEAKGRPSFNPVIVHVNDKVEAEKIVTFDDRAALLASIFWPGPLTLILPRRADAGLSLLTSAGLPSQAVRAPVHPIARALIAALGRPIAAPSANASGTLSPTTPQHVANSLGDRAGLILAGGKAVVGLESTVLDLTGITPVMLRPGGVTRDEIEMQLGAKIAIEFEAVSDAPRSPGQLLNHYAPKTPLRLKAVDVAPGEALLAFGSIRFMGIRGGGAARDLPDGALLNLSETGDLTTAAANLFSMLHQLDGGGFNSIAVMDIPDVGLGVAINDRLKRATGAQKT
ncbi:MAG TPA: L-threonylcarbamoyladenylate synthase [Patescibacteria group bacterium]|nr:L-threonylcarbamoyladenylate synthase [Patescibacteria group bacterium]